MAQELKKTELRAVQYFFVDGSFEFGFGLLCLILAVFLYVDTHIQGWLSALVTASLVLVLIGGGWLIKWMIKLLKERLTWPRTGYVTYRRREDGKRSWRMATGLLIGGAVSGGTMILVKNPNLHFAAMPLVSGVLFGLVMVFMGWRARLGRFPLYGGISLSIGAILAFSGLQNIAAVCVYYLAFGLFLFITGACVLWAYLRQNPAAAEEQA